MAIDITATVLEKIDPAEIVARLYPDEATRPRFEVHGQVLIGDDRPGRGYTLYVAQGEDGYVEATAGDDGPVITKEPGEYGDVEFVLDKFKEPSVVDAAVLDMLARLLETGDEDVVVVQNGQILLLSRCDGELRRYEAGFWEAVTPDAIPPLFRIPAAEPEE
jgi:hypothetical protein